MLFVDLDMKSGGKKDASGTVETSICMRPSSPVFERDEPSLVAVVKATGQLVVATHPASRTTNTRKKRMTMCHAKMHGRRLRSELKPGSVATSIDSQLPGVNCLVSQSRRSRGRPKKRFTGDMVTRDLVTFDTTAPTADIQPPTVADASAMLKPTSQGKPLGSLKAYPESRLHTDSSVNFNVEETMYRSNGLTGMDAANSQATLVGPIRDNTVVNILPLDTRQDALITSVNLDTKSCSSVQPVITLSSRTSLKSRRVYSRRPAKAYKPPNPYESTNIDADPEIKDILMKLMKEMTLKVSWRLTSQRNYSKKKKHQSKQNDGITDSASCNSAQQSLEPPMYLALSTVPPPDYWKHPSDHPTPPPASSISVEPLKSVKNVSSKKTTSDLHTKDNVCLRITRADRKSVSTHSRHSVVNASCSTPATPAVHMSTTMKTVDVPMNLAAADAPPPPVTPSAPVKRPRGRPRKYPIPPGQEEAHAMKLKLQRFYRHIDGISGSIRGRKRSRPSAIDQLKQKPEVAKRSSSCSVLVHLPPVDIIGNGLHRSGTGPAPKRSRKIYCYDDMNMLESYKRRADAAKSFCQRRTKYIRRSDVGHRRKDYLAITQPVRRRRHYGAGAGAGNRTKIQRYRQLMPGVTVATKTRDKLTTHAIDGPAVEKMTMMIPATQERCKSSLETEVFQTVMTKCGFTPKPQVDMAPPTVVFGTATITAWHRAPYPAECAALDRLHICEFCLTYLKSKRTSMKHVQKCPLFGPPGLRIYRNRNLAVFEVNGGDSITYCQNLCLLSKLFLDHKTLYSDVEPFLFYILTRLDRKGYHFIGYFSKEKVCGKHFNLSCIMVLPLYQRMGFGSFLIDFSYMLTRREMTVGTPERPLSELGRLSYLTYWKKVISKLLAKLKVDNVTLEELSERTGMIAADICETLKTLKAFKAVGGRLMIVMPSTDDSDSEGNQSDSIITARSRRRRIRNSIKNNKQLPSDSGHLLDWHPETNGAPGSDRNHKAAKLAGSARNCNAPCSRTSTARTTKELRQQSANVSGDRNRRKIVSGLGKVIRLENQPNRAGPKTLGQSRDDGSKSRKRVPQLLHCSSSTSNAWASAKVCRKYCTILLTKMSRQRGDDARIRAGSIHVQLLAKMCNRRHPARDVMCLVWRHIYSIANSRYICLNKIASTGPQKTARSLMDSTYEEELIDSRHCLREIKTVGKSDQHASASVRPSEGGLDDRLELDRSENTEESSQRTAADVTSSTLSSFKESPSFVRSINPDEELLFRQVHADVVMSPQGCGIDQSTSLRSSSDEQPHNPDASTLEDHAIDNPGFHDIATYGLPAGSVLISHNQQAYDGFECDGTRFNRGDSTSKETHLEVVQITNQPIPVEAVQYNDGNSVGLNNEKDIANYTTPGPSAAMLGLQHHGFGLQALWQTDSYNNDPLVPLHFVAQQFATNSLRCVMSHATAHLSGSHHLVYTGDRPSPRPALQPAITGCPRFRCPSSNFHQLERYPVAGMVFDEPDDILNRQLGCPQSFTCSGGSSFASQQRLSLASGMSSSIGWLNPIHQNIIPPMELSRIGIPAPPFDLNSDTGYFLRMPQPTIYQHRSRVPIHANADMLNLSPAVGAENQFVSSLPVDQQAGACCIRYVPRNDTEPTVEIQDRKLSYGAVNDRQEPSSPRSNTVMQTPRMS